MYGDSETSSPSQRDSSSTLSDYKCSRIASTIDKSSKPRTSQPREKREVPRKENSKKKPKLLPKESIKQENNPKTGVVRIHVLDPDATDSSSEEEEEVVVSCERKVKVHKIQIPHYNHLHESQRRELLRIKREGRRKKAKEHEKKNAGLSSCSSCTSFEGVHGGGDEELESLEMPGLCDIPGPIPDLEILMKDETSFIFNFFKGLPDEWLL